MQLKNVWSCIVAHHIQIVFSFDNFLEIDIGHENALSVVIRSCEDHALRVHNDAATPNKNRYRIVTLNGGIVDGTIAPAEILNCGEYEAAAFTSYMLHGATPGVAVIDGRRTVEFDALAYMAVRSRGI